MSTVRFSPYMREKSAPCPVCGKDLSIQANIDPPPLPTPTPMPRVIETSHQPPPIPMAQPDAGINSKPPRAICGMAIAGMILGITSIVPGLMCGGPFLGLLGVIFSGQALYRINRRPLELDGRGMAIAGLTMSIIGLFIGLVIIGLLVLGGAMMKASLEPLTRMLPPGPVK